MNLINQYPKTMFIYQVWLSKESKSYFFVFCIFRPYCRQQLQMFDKQKQRQLEQRSHTRGLLSKEFYHNEQAILQQKRKTMKEELDRQVQQRRKQKQLEKMAQERKVRQEEQDIKNYYRNLQNREKKYSSNQSNMKQSKAPYQTYPNEQESRVQPANRNRGASKPSLVADGDIPLLPVMPPDNTAPSAFQNNQGILSNSKSKVNFISQGAIPLLDLSEQQSHHHIAKTKKGKKTKRQKTLEAQLQAQFKEQPTQKVYMSRYNQPTSHERQKSNHHQQQRKSTLPDEQSIMGSIVRNGNSLERNGNSLERKQHEDGSLKQIQEVEHENNSLKMELRKNQEAISLLMGAVRSNGKLQKFRVQAQKILTGNMQSSMASKKQEEKKEQACMLPRINLRNQSIMHDYLLSAAKRSKKSVGK